ncbi:MAG: DegV family protein [Candidatus Izimaplasma sp.]|nr:DegV family protein [Candidatus Izimaplasma bacterium]
MKIAVLTDSAANLSKEFIEKHKNLFVVPLMIVVDKKEYRDQIEITASEVYEKLDTSEVSTSLPANEDLMNTLDEIKKQEYTHVIVINISSGLSGTYNSFRLILENEKDLKVIHYDSKTLGAEEGFLVEYALELVEKKTPLKNYIELFDKLRKDDTIAFYTINTLKYLRRGGRIGKVEGTLGDILHIKPIITVNEEGVYVTLSKAFGMKRSLLRMKNILIEKYKKDKIDLVIHYGDNEDVAKELAEKLKPVLNIRNLSLVRLTPVLGVHTGPEIIAYVARRL